MISYTFMVLQSFQNSFRNSISLCSHISVKSVKEQTSSMLLLIFHVCKKKKKRTWSMWSLQTHIVIKVPLLVELPSWQAAEKHRNLVQNSSSVLFPEPSRETITLNPPHSREEKTLGLLTAELYFCCDLAPFEGRNKKNDHLFKVYLFLVNFHFLIISNMLWA